MTDLDIFHKLLLFSATSAVKGFGTRTGCALVFRNQGSVFLKMVSLRWECLNMWHFARLGGRS